MTSEGDGRKGHPQGAPFDAIHVGAAAPVLPQDVRIAIRKKMEMQGLFKES